MNYDSLVKQCGGVLATHQLLGCGHTAEDIREALAIGALEHVRHGWYALPEADPDIVAAVKDRGVLSCASALRRAGLWVPDHPKTLHSRVTRHERRESHDRCRRYGRPNPATRSVDDVLDALTYAARCFDKEGLVILADSAMNLGLATHDELHTAFRLAPDKIRRAIDTCHAGAASGTETAARLRLKAHGIKVKVQHAVPGVGRVDLLVGDRLALELDSRTHHSDENYTVGVLLDRLTNTRPAEIHPRNLSPISPSGADPTTICRQPPRRGRKSGAVDRGGRNSRVVFRECGRRSGRHSGPVDTDLVTISK